MARLYQLRKEGEEERHYEDPNIPSGNLRPAEQDRLSEHVFVNARASSFYDHKTGRGSAFDD